MSVIAQSELLDLLKKEELIISPILDRSQIGTVSIDVRLGTVALVVRETGVSYIDPRSYIEAENAKGHLAEKGRRQKFDRTDVPFKQPYLLHPGALVLAPTLEWFRLPKILKGVVTARSSWAREGLSIATATFVDPGYTGIITLELANLGRVPIALYPGMRIAQIAFYDVRGEEILDRSREFNMSFEPRAGRITNLDEPFIPVASPTR